MGNHKLAPPWLALILYSFTIAIDWIFAYYVEILPQIITNSWSVFFPITTFFYVEFSVLAFIGIYARSIWGFGLGFIMIMCGGCLCVLSYLLAIQYYPEILDYLILVLVINIAVFSYLIIYDQNHPMSSD